MTGPPWNLRAPTGLLRRKSPDKPATAGFLRKTAFRVPLAAMKSIAPAALAEALDSSVAPLLMDVRLAGDHAARRIPGSANNCVYEVAFHERLPQCAPEKDRTIVLYGSSGESHEALWAAEKLARVGYADLAILEGGLDAWEKAGFPTETGDGQTETPPSPEGRLPLDLAECRLEWTGRNLLNKHSGTIDLTSGFLDFTRGALTGGEIEFDVRTIRCTDLAGTDLHDILIHHLLDHDFLDAALHPLGRLVIREAAPLPDAAPGLPNLRLTADLTLRGKTEPLEFDAATGFTADGKPAAQAVFAIDRTRWGMLYGSARFFHHLAGHLVNDLIHFEVRIVTK